MKMTESFSLAIFLLAGLAACSGGSSSELQTVGARYTAAQPAVLAETESTQETVVLEVFGVQSTPVEIR